MSGGELRLVVNTSPLIHLVEAGRLDLLQAVAPTVRVPEPVAHHLWVRGGPMSQECAAERGLSPLIKDKFCDAIREDGQGMDQADSDTCFRSNDASRLHGSAAL